MGSNQAWSLRKHNVTSSYFSLSFLKILLFLFAVTYISNVKYSLQILILSNLLFLSIVLVNFVIY